MKLRPPLFIVAIAIGVLGWLVLLIFEGDQTQDQPQTAFLLFDDGNKWAGICTATLVSCDQVLTAAHCLKDSSQSSDYRLYMQHAGMFSASSLSTYCGEKGGGCDSAINDLALIELAQPLPNIVPIERGENLSWNPGSDVSIVGFGPATTSDPTGIKRHADVKPARYLNLFVVDPHGLPLNTTSGICSDDSGGPMFTLPDQKLIGVAKSSWSGCKWGQGIWLDASYADYKGWLDNKTSDRECEPASNNPIAVLDDHHALKNSMAKQYTIPATFSGDAQLNLNFESHVGTDFEINGTGVVCSANNKRGETMTCTLSSAGGKEFVVKNVGSQLSKKAEYQLLVLPAL